MNEMPDIIGGFSQIEYLTIFNTIIFGIISSEYFSGWGNMFRHRDTIKIDYVHLFWTIFAFLTLIQNWYGIWPRTVYINQSILYFYYGLVPMLIFHLISVVLFPSSKYIISTDFEVYYKKNARALFLLFAFYLAITILNSFIYDDKGNVLAQNIIRGLGLILAVIGAFIVKRWLHATFLVLGFIGLFQFLFFLAD